MEQPLPPPPRPMPNNGYGVASLAMAIASLAFLLGPITTLPFGLALAAAAVVVGGSTLMSVKSVVGVFIGVASGLLALLSFLFNAT